MESVDEDRIEVDALNSIWRIERMLWRFSLKRNIRNERSRFYKNVSKFGVPVSSLILVGNLWRRVAYSLIAISVVMAISFGRGSITPRTFAIIGAAFFFFSLYRIKCASNMAKMSPTSVRQTRSRSHRH
jgi:hypothetical protein